MEAVDRGGKGGDQGDLRGEVGGVLPEIGGKDMNAIQAQEILQMLLNGIDPVTGEIFPDDHVCNEPDVIRAFHHAITALGKECIQNQQDDKGKTDKSKDPSTENAGKPWTSEDDGNLIEMYEDGVSITKIAAHYKRTRGAIRSRLVKLGLEEDKDHIPESKVGSDIPIDNEELRDMLLHGKTIPELAQQYGRSEKAIRARLFYMGFGGEGPDVMPYRNNDDY